VIRLAGMTSIFPDMTLDEGIAALKRYGYDGLEARVEWGHKSGIEASLSASERADVRKKVEDAGLEICAIATSVRAAEADDAARAKHMKDLETYIDLAADLGAKYVRTFGGQRPRDRDLKYIVDYVVAAYQSVLPRAEDRGVVVLMETHDDWSHSSEVAAVVERVNHPNLKVLWDIMHPQRMMEKPEETFNVIGALTRHLHAHDGTYPEGGTRVQMAPLGEGIFDHATPLRLLQQAGFDGYFSVEIIHAPGSEHDAEGVLKQYAAAFRAMVGR
jgi:sugar phosphate isomerase/epimerase